LAIFISNRHKDKIKVRSCYSCSLGYLEGSKGAASILLDVDGTTMAFLCCHLSSNQPRDKQRNYRFMVEDVGALGDKHFSIISQVHHVVVFGDLNYRITEVTADQVLKEITKAASPMSVWKYDTMRKDIVKGLAFSGFREPRPREDFLPTYKKKTRRRVEIKKYDSGKLDVKKSNKWLFDVYRTKYKEPMYKGGAIHERIPSFTDRVIVYSLPTLRRKDDLSFEKDSAPYQFQKFKYPNADNYGCIYGLAFSDHTPIYAGLRLKLPHKLKRPPCEFYGEQPKAYRLRLADIRVSTPEEKCAEIRSIRTLFPLHYENGNTETKVSEKVDFFCGKELSQGSWRSANTIDDFGMFSLQEMVTLSEMLVLESPSNTSNPKPKPKPEHVSRILESVPDHPAIELKYRGPHFRDMNGVLHCLIKVTIGDGKELEGGFETVFSDFLECEKQPKNVVVQLFLKGRQSFGSAKINVYSDLVV